MKDTVTPQAAYAEAEYVSGYASAPSAPGRRTTRPREAVASTRLTNVRWKIFLVMLLLTLAAFKTSHFWVHYEAPGEGK